MADVADPRGDVARLSPGRVVADLEFDLETGARVPRGHPLEVVDGGLAVGPEQAVETENERTSLRTELAQGGEIPRRAYPRPSAAGRRRCYPQSRVDSEPHAARPAAPARHRNCRAVRVGCSRAVACRPAPYPEWRRATGAPKASIRAKRFTSGFRCATRSTRRRSATLASGVRPLMPPAARPAVSPTGAAGATRAFASSRPLADLALGEIVHTPQGHHAALELRKLAPCLSDRLTASARSNPSSSQPSHSTSRRCPHPRCKGGHRATWSRSCGRRHPPRAPAPAAIRAHSRAPGRWECPSRWHQPLSGPTHRQRLFLEVPWDVDPPALITEMALQLSEDRRRREACEPIAPIRIESIDRLQESETRDLHQIVQRLIRVVVAKRHLADERHESLYELVAGTTIAMRVAP